jgi:hypothetical protein
MSKTTVDGLAKAIQKTLAEYEGVTVDNMKAAVDKVSKEAVRELKASSPRRSGAYAKSWAAKKARLTNKWAYQKTVYNKDHYRLTHLLEKGHKVVGAKNGRTRVDPIPHIEKVEKKAVENLVREMKETL